MLKKFPKELLQTKGKLKQWKNRSSEENLKSTGIVSG